MHISDGGVRLGFVALALALTVACSRRAADAEADEQVPYEDFALAVGADIDAVEAYQGVRIPIFNASPVEDGSVVPVPILAGRDLFLRVGLEATDPVGSRGVAVVVQWTAPDGSAQVARQVGDLQSWRQNDLDTTFDFTLPGATIPLDFAFEVSVHEKRPWVLQEGQVGEVSWTSDGLDVQPTDTIHLVIVPVDHRLGGETASPDTSDEQMALLRQTVAALYPVTEVDLTVREAVVFDEPINAGGWQTLLGEITALRDIDKRERGMAPNTYYYGLIAPEENQSGIGGVGNFALFAEEEWARAATGLGYPGMSTAWTLVHELGHNHGRYHPWCDNPLDQDLDQAYPYELANIGSWGYDPDNERLIPPGQTYDMMSYCDPVWISDYNYAALHERVLDVARLSRGAEVEAFRIAVDADGWGTVGAALLTPTRRSGQPVEVALHGAEVETVDGWFYPYDHLAGGVVLVDEAVAGTRAQVLGPR